MFEFVKKFFSRPDPEDEGKYVDAYVVTNWRDNGIIKTQFEKCSIGSSDVLGQLYYWGPEGRIGTYFWDEDEGKRFFFDKDKAIDFVEAKRLRLLRECHEELATLDKPVPVNVINVVDRSYTKSVKA